MGNLKIGAATVLFESVSYDGSSWQFVVRTHDGWAITRDGKTVAVGAGDLTSIKSGVQKFLLLTAARKQQAQAACG